MLRRPLLLSCAVLALLSGLALVPSAGSAAAAGPVTAAPGTYVAITPHRVLDTRSATGVPTTTPVPSGGVVPVDVAGQGELPSSGVGAVVATLTVTETRADGYLVAWADGSDVPQTSSLNWSAGQTVANSAVIPVGSDGRLLLQSRSTGSVQVVLDVEGYYAAGKPTTPGAYTPMAPQRVLDTRKAVGVTTTTPLAAGSTTPVRLGGRGGPAAGASAVVLNLTAVGGTAGGYVGLGGPTALPSGGSVLTWAGSRPVASLVVAPLAADGTISLYVGSSGPVHLVADLVGTFGVGALTDAGTTRVDRPYRQLDTREAGSGGALPPGVPRAVTPTAGPLGYAPGDVSAVVVTLTVTNTRAPGYLTGYASGGTRPTTSLLNWLPGQTVSATVVLPVGSDGRFVLVNGSKGATDVVVDLGGTVLARALPVAPGWSAAALPGSAGSGVVAPVDAACADGGPCALSTRGLDPVRHTTTGALWRRDGGTWSSPTAVPFTSTGTGGTVACSASGLCAALVPTTGGSAEGLSTSTPGTSWSTVAAPLPSGGTTVVLTDLTCPRGGTTCWAVGVSHTSTVPTVTAPYAAVDDGSGWRSVPVPFPAGAQGTLGAVACASDTACTAVGNTVPAASPVLASWDGSAWTSSPVSGPAGNTTGGLLSVAYRGSDVVATGSTSDGTQYAVVGSGGTWTPTTMTDQSFLGDDLACERGGGQCFVDRGPETTPTVVDGLVTVPGDALVPVGASAVTTTGVHLSLSCGDATGCVAAGSMRDTVVGDRGVVQEERSGSWTSALLPVPADAVEAALRGQDHVVACDTGECLVVSPYVSRSGTALSVATRAAAG